MDVAQDLTTDIDMDRAAVLERALLELAQRASPPEDHDGGASSEGSPKTGDGIHYAGACGYCGNARLAREPGMPFGHEHRGLFVPRANDINALVGTGLENRIDRRPRRVVGRRVTA